MTQPFEDLAGLDRLIHEPTRLAILTALSACAVADFLYLQSLTGVTKGNLSNHLAKLEDGGLIALEKTYDRKTPRTRVHLTASGVEAIARHWQRLEELHEAARAWTPAVAPRINPQS